MNALLKRACDWLVEERRRELIVALEQALAGHPEALGPDAFVTRHHYAPGSYAREIELPAGSCVVGKIHRHAHVNVVSKGCVLVYTAEDGLLEIEAPMTFVSKAGTKRAVLALEDAVWTTVHVTEETDLAAIERDIIAPTFAALEHL